MKETKTTKGKAYLNDFKLNEKGEYEYRGTKHAFHTPSFSYAQARNRLLLYTTIMLGCAFGIGLFPAAGTTNTMYVVIPYTVCLVCCSIFLFRFVSFLMAKDPIRDYLYKKTVVRFPIYLNIIQITAIIALVMEGVYLILHGFNNMVVATLFYCLGLVGVILFSYAWLKFFHTLKWKEVSD
ncbi:MAG: hypothetical protein J6D29_09385 [Solobacterium sp.]|nr:hypothetical protein [Solobacterium sp.]